VIVDIAKEHIAISEAHKLNIPTFAIVDTNTDPTKVDFPIPGNDDATKSVGLIISLMTKAIEEGLSERKVEKEMDKEKEASVEKEGEVENRRLVAVEDEDDDKSGKKNPKAPAPGKPSARPRTNKAPTRR
jgi:small subunit ribosomal protein S2